MVQGTTIRGFVAKFYPDPSQRPNARWRTALRVAANHKFEPEFRETYIRGVLRTNTVARWQEEDMYELAFTIIECATETPLPVNAGDRYAAMMKMVCDSYSKCFNDVTRFQFIACFKRALHDVFMFYWGDCPKRSPFAVGQPQSSDLLVDRALALCDFIAALNPKNIISHVEMVPFVQGLYTNALTLHHLRGVDTIIGTAGSYLWLDPPDPMGNAEAFVAHFTEALAHSPPKWNGDPNLPEGVESTEDYIQYIVKKAKRFAAYHAKRPPVLLHLLDDAQYVI